MSQIYNGSFVLGDTSATTLSAGNGIKLDTSVPGIIGISNDETVLYNKSWTNAGGNATLSESAANFKQLLITYNIEATSETYTPVYTILVDIETMLNNTSNRTFELECTFTRSDGSNNYIISRAASVEMNGATLTINYVNQSINFGAIAAMANSSCRIMKVIGINRIAGGN